MEDRDKKHDLADYHNRRLEEYRRSYEHGSLPALFDALVYCRRKKCAIPNWIMDGAIYEVGQLLSGQAFKGKNSAKSRVTKFKKYWRHFVRWDAVMELRDKQLETKNELTQLMKIDPDHQATMDLKRRTDVIIWEHVYEIAAESLLRSPFHAGPEAIRRSYLDINRYRKRGTHRGVVGMVPSARALELMGLPNQDTLPKSIKDRLAGSG
ncbi:MAG: hypothetical protein O7D27_02340 [Alphaproteobacteria bacterium]|nr:hypothetical protein [Alphaproteobacteria bacterium]